MKKSPNDSPDESLDFKKNFKQLGTREIMEKSDEKMEADTGAFKG